MANAALVEDAVRRSTFRIPRGNRPKILDSKHHRRPAVPFLAQAKREVIQPSLRRTALSEAHESNE